LCVLDMLTEGPAEAVLAGDGAEPAMALGAALGRHFMPNRIIVHAPSAIAPAELTHGKGAVDGQAMLYLCRHQTCQRPVSDPGDVAAVVDVDRKQRKSQ
jgi:hypothetical protein